MRSWVGIVRRPRVRANDQGGTSPVVASGADCDACRDDRPYYTSACWEALSVVARYEEVGLPITQCGDGRADAQTFFDNGKRV